MIRKQLFPFSTNLPNMNVKHIDEMIEFGYRDNGRDIIDLGLGSSGCFTLGFKRTDILDRIIEKVKVLPFCQADFTTSNAYIDECGQKLYDVSGGYRTLFSLSGSDAIESCVKMVRMYHLNRNQHKKEIIGFIGSYHGSTYMSSSVSGATYITDLYGKHPDCKLVELPRYPGMGCRNECATNEEAELNNLQIIKDSITENTAAIFVESVSWEAGLWVTSKDWWKGLREICDEHDILLVVDDVAFCGGKTGTIFGWQVFDVKPDIFAIGKGITGGYFAASAALCNEKVYQEIAPQIMLHGFSYSFPVGGIVGILEYLRVLEEENILENHTLVVNAMKEKVIDPLISKGLLKGSRNFGVCFKLIPGFDAGSFADKDELLYRHGLHMGLWNSHQGGILVMVPMNANNQYFTMLLDRFTSLLEELRTNNS